MKCQVRLFATVLALLVFVFVQAAAAQGDKGSVVGHVSDSAGAALQGASVELQPGDVIINTNQQGNYFFRNLTPGTYTITITYVGFKLFTKAVQVSAGQPVTIDATLEVQTQSEQVFVTAERASGEVEALNRERTADNLVQVLPSEVIRSLPNANMADALGRLPSVTLERDEGEGKYVQVRGTEPRLTNATVDGVNIASPESGVRNIKFDAIPADIVESVEINKTLQANMDGDGIGGSVNLVTKTAGERPTVAFYGLGGYSPINGGRNNYESTGTLGKRFGSSKKLGVLVGGSYDWNGRGIDDIEPVPDIASYQSGYSQRFFDSQDLREYRYYRTRWAVSGSVDYQLGQGSSIYIRGLYSYFKNFGDRWVYSLTDNTPLFNPSFPNLYPNGPTLVVGKTGCTFANENPNDPNSPLIETCGQGTPSFNVSTRRPRYAIGNIVLGGKHVFNTWWATWDISTSAAHENDTGYGSGSFVASPALQTSNCTYSSILTTAKYRPQWDPVCFTEAYNTANLSINDYNVSGGQTNQFNLQGAGALGKSYHIGSHNATLEIGGKFRNNHKYDHTFSVDYNTPNFANPNSLLLTNFIGTFQNSNYYDGSYKFGPAANYNQVHNFVVQNANNFTIVDSSSGNSANYQYVEQIAAGYIMNSIDWSKFRLVAGVRFEGTNLYGLTWDNGIPANPPDPGIPAGLNQKIGNNYLNVLGSAALRYALTSDTNIRLVFGQGVSRPNPQDIAQALTVNFVAPNDAKNSVSIGNPSLKAETANNYDLLFEHYLKPFGAITAGVFYKSLYHPIVGYSYVGLPPQLPPAYAKYQSEQFTVSQPINAGSAHLYGFEVAYTQQYTFLPGAWRGLGLSANYSYTDSGTGGVPGRSDHPHLVRQAPNTWNVSPTYDYKRFSLRVGLSYNQANIHNYQYQDGIGGGIKGPLSDTYFYTHFQVDAQGTYTWKYGLTFVVYGMNLNNEVFGFYNGSPQYMIQREYYTPTYGFGLRWSPAAR